MHTEEEGDGSLQALVEGAWQHWEKGAVPDIGAEKSEQRHSLREEA